MSVEALPRSAARAAAKTECHIGVQRIEAVPLHAIIILPQSRPECTYSAEGKQELVDSMSVPGSDDINLITPLSVAVFHSLEEAETYAIQVCSILGKQFDQDLPPAPDDNYYILVAGHNRVDAIHIKIADSERLTATLEEGAVYVGCSLLDSPDALTALSLQLAENKHERPPLSTDAIAIHGLYMYLTSQEGLSDADARETLRERLGMSGDKISKALLYMFMPQEIRQLAAEKYTITSRYAVITQSDILALCSRELINMYEKLAQREVLEPTGDGEDPITRYVGQRLMAVAYELIGLKLRYEKDKKRVNMKKFVEGVKEGVQHELDHTGELFYQSVDNTPVSAERKAIMARQSAIKDARDTVDNCAALANRLQSFADRDTAEKPGLVGSVALFATASS